MSATNFPNCSETPFSPLRKATLNLDDLFRPPIELPVVPPRLSSLPRRLLRRRLRLRSRKIKLYNCRQQGIFQYVKRSGIKLLLTFPFLSSSLQSSPPRPFRRRPPPPPRSPSSSAFRVPWRRRWAGKPALGRTRRPGGRSTRVGCGG